MVNTQNQPHAEGAASAAAAADYAYVLKRRAWRRLLSIAVVACTAATATPANAQEAYLRVVDVGAGLCVVATIPGGHSLVYDGGFGKTLCLNAVRELVPDKKIDLLVLSHSDGDHIGAAKAILEENEVATIIHPNDTRTGKTLKAVRTAIASEPNADVWNMKTRPVPFGSAFPIGPAVATFIAGWKDGKLTRQPGDPELTDQAMRHNALSLVIRLQYAGHSILLTGDAVGRPAVNDDTLCRYAERYMDENAATIPIQSDVLIGQHHGADNATANCFIEAVRPTYVVFSAGHKFRHPRQSTADRLVSNGILPEKILRTDRGDHEGGSGRTKEWLTGSLAGCKDAAGDDDVEVRLPSDPNVPVKVAYKVPSTHC